MVFSFSLTQTHLSMLQVGSHHSLSDVDVSTTNESTENTVLRFFNESLGILVSKSDIRIALRLASSHSGSTAASARSHPPIVVKYIRRSAPDSIYAARKQLKSIKPGVLSMNI